TYHDTPSLHVALPICKPMGAIHHIWTPLVERIGLGKLRIHDLRHTFASHAAMNKETLPMIGRLLGHANHQSTARYAHLDDEHLRSEEHTSELQSRENL